MNIDEIKRNAPDGATHYSRQIERYFKITNKNIYIYRLNCWVLTHKEEPKDTTPIGQVDYGFNS